MAYKSIIGATCACLAVVSITADAALMGRLAATSGGSDYQAYYDTESNLTWLADANYAMTSGYDANGLMNWADANGWAAELNIAGVDGWRLADKGASCIGYNCTNSVMGNLFYNVLGNTGGSLISNTGPFSNVQSNFYWLASGWAADWDDGSLWKDVFSMGDGEMSEGTRTTNYYAWAVQSGDIGSVPIPAAVWLFSSGLIGLIGLARRKQSA